MISEFLFYEQNSTKDENHSYVNLKIEIRELIKNNFDRKVLAEILLDLRKDVSGETQRRLFQLYQDLGLHEDAFKKLDSWRWEVISKGIYELTQMQVEDSYGFITKFINNKRGTIRKQAEIAIVTLKNEGINYFLDTTEYRISEWQQLKLLDVIRNQDDFQPPRFKAWLTSSNKHVVLFALRLIKHYNQNDAFASLIELIKHRNNQIKQEAISCIKDFNVVEALHTLKLVFWKSSVDIKISILDTIAEIGTKAELDFLKSIEKKESNFSVKSKVFSCINSIAPESIMPTRGIVQIKGNQMPEDVVTETTDDVEHQIEDIIAHAKEDSNDIVEIEPIKEEIKENSNEDKTTEELEKPIASAQDDKSPTISVDFLPIVIDGLDKNTTESHTTQKDQLVNESEYVKEIHKIKVVFEEIDPGPLGNNKLSEEKEEIEVCPTNDFDINELTFLPIVVDDSISVEKEHEPVNHSDEQLDSKKPNVKEFYEEAGIEVDFILNMEKTDRLDFSLIDSLNETAYNTDPVSSKKAKNIDVSNDIVEFEEIQIEISDIKIKGDSENVLDWPLDESNKQESSALNFVPFVLEEDKPIDDDFNKYQDIKDILDILPKPKYCDGETIITMRLLDDIEELGDQREIPLLQELREKAIKEIIKNRIGDIIQKFQVNEPKLKSKEIIESISDVFKPFSVFEDLFRTCDTDSKLILLDEIVSVGDEKELGFLNDLLKDSEIKIRVKAKIVLQELENRLFHESLSFELVGEFIGDSKDNTSTDVGNQNSFLDQLLSLRNRIVIKLNG